MKRTYGLGEARSIAEGLAVDFARVGFDLEQFRSGLDVEAEHGNADPSTNVTDDDPLTTGKIALAHLNEFPDYYTRLGAMEAEAKSARVAGEESSEPDVQAKSGTVKKFAIGLALVVIAAAVAVCLRAARARKR